MPVPGFFSDSQIAHLIEDAGARLITAMVTRKLAESADLSPTMRVLVAKLLQITLFTLAVVIGLAQQMGVDPRPFVVGVMFAASCSFATPIGYQTNTLVYGAGNYRFADFLRIGIPMNIVVGLTTCAAIYVYYGM